MVMLAKSRARLLDEDAVGAMRDHLLPLAVVITPNAPEAEVLTTFGSRRWKISTARPVASWI